MNNVLVKLFPGLMILALLVIAGVSYNFIFRPGLDRLSQGRDLDLASFEQSLNTVQENLAQVKKLRQNFDEIKADPNLERLRFSLPSDLDLPGLLVQLEALAVENGLQLSRVEVTEQPEVAAGAISPPPVGRATVVSITPQLPLGVRKANISLTLGNSDYSSLKSFLTAIESNLRLIDLISFNFDPKGGSQNLTLTTYYFKE